MPALNKIALTAALTLLTSPAWAALTYTGTGSYNLGTPSNVGATAAPTTSCGSISGQDALQFTGVNADNIGLHAYACDDNIVSFGSRSSGEGTYFVQGIASVLGSLSVGEDNYSFNFYINPGEVGAFGSTGFAAGEFQTSKLTIKLTIDGTTYVDEAWSATVGTAGDTSTSGYTSNGTYTVGTNVDSGSGYYSFGLQGGYYSIALGQGDHDISYVMTSEASGSVSNTSICTAYLQGNPRQEATRALVAEVPADGPPTGEAFTSYCGAGARSGDPFPSFDPANDFGPIARAQAVEELPEPMTAALTLTALLAAAGVRRRNKR
ncbi:PEP-CTERM exosortase interaction domain protein [Ostertagia ostertagi]